MLVLYNLKHGRKAVSNANKIALMLQKAFPDIVVMPVQESKIKLEEAIAQNHEIVIAEAMELITNVLIIMILQEKLLAL